MASASAMQVPARSFSLPPRLHNPSFLKIEAEFNKLKICESSSAAVALETIPLRAESVKNGLIEIVELYDFIEEFIHSPSAQQALCKQQHKDLVEQALDMSVALLDACSNARDVILITKEQLQELQSALRRRSVDSSLERNIHAYISFRKKSRKHIAQCMRELKRLEANLGSFHTVEGNQHLSMVIQMLRE